MLLLVSAVWLSLLHWIAIRFNLEYESFMFFFGWPAVLCIPAGFYELIARFLYMFSGCSPE